MAEKTNGVRRAGLAVGEIDDTDRMLLGHLTEDAGQSYASLGNKLHLSPPAVHERVRRLKARGVIKSIAARLDPDLIGKPLLAFIHVDAQGWAGSPEMTAISSLPEIEEIHSVAGDTCFILKARTSGTRSLEELLARIYAAPGVTSTRSFIALRTHSERGTQARIELLGRNPEHLPEN